MAEGIESYVSVLSGSVVSAQVAPDLVEMKEHTALLCAHPPARAVVRPVQT
jgi:hypothetical protein